MTLTGLYTGNATADFTAAEQWLGSSNDLISARSGKASWTDWRGSLGWQIQNMSGVNATKVWNIPLFPVQGNLHDGASGLYNTDYAAFARQLVAAYGTEQPILVRTGEEFNGNWFGWSATQDPQDFIQNYRNFVDAFRSVSSNFKFEWNVNIGGSMDPATAYPGDHYVDYVGMDFYWDSGQSWSFTDPVAAFTYFKDEPYGLQWLEDFASAHGKPSAYSEWGVNSANAAPFIQLVKAWFDDHNVAYEFYWDSNADFAGKLDNGRYGAASDMFKALFGGSHPLSAPIAADSSLQLIGTDGGDTLAAGDGNNYLSGGGGADILTAGGGNNHIWGNAASSGSGATDGADVIVVGAGCNYINGNAGNDLISVGATGSLGHNRVYGGQGDDTITIIGAGANSVNGNIGNDQIHAERATGANLLRGGQGDDHLYGGAGTDTLMGDAGNDVLFASSVAGHLTTMTGGAGADVFQFAWVGAGSPAAGQAQIVTDFTSGIDHLGLPFVPAAADLLRDAGGSSYASITQALPQAQLLLSAHAGYHDVAALQVGADTILFYNQAGTADTIDGAIRLTSVTASALSPSDFT